MSTSKKMDKLIDVYSYNGMQLSKKKERIAETHNNMDDSHRHYSELMNERVHLY